ncbi:conserved hypothetical protein, partial [Perkinsus marinus ATCC 50983]
MCLCRLDPSVEELQSAVNGGAVSILKCSKMIEAWDTVTIPKSVQMILNPNLPPVISLGSQGTFYDRVAQDKEILKVILMLTGAVQNSEDECNVYLERFSCYGWLWEDSIEDKYKEFEATNPTLDDFECKLRSFAQLDEKLDLFESSRQIGALLLRPESLAKGLKGLANEWKVAFSKQLHVKARDRLEALTEQIKTTAKRMNRTVEDGDIDALGYVMRTLNDVRRKQSEIELEFGPITHMYAILDTYLPNNVMDKDEQDARSMLKRNWLKLVEESEKRQQELCLKQAEYKKTLIQTVNNFKKDVRDFRKNYESHGPMVNGIAPREAVERLKRFKEEFEVRSRKQEIYYLGEDLFGLPHQQYPKLEKTKQELGYLAQLYDLYVLVLETIKEWKDYLWTEVPQHIEDMRSQIEVFSNRCKKMPKQLREWPAYHELKKEIEDFSEALPLLVELAKPSIMPRHWQQVQELTGKELPVDSEMFMLQSLIDANLQEHIDEVTDICDSADKQLIIEKRLADITSNG